jgi:hypothetical protein
MCAISLVRGVRSTAFRRQKTSLTRVNAVLQTRSPYSHAIALGQTLAFFLNIGYPDSSENIYGRVGPGRAG